MTGNGILAPLPDYCEEFLFSDFKVSWAGAVGSRLCYGSEDGRLEFVNDDGSKLKTDRISDSAEAINGLAAIGNCHAVSTRANVTFIWNLFSSQGNAIRGALPSGAHGVIATPGGFFIAPMGQHGLMIAKSTGAREQDIFLSNDPDNKIYFYRSIALPGPGESDIIVSAVRRGGIAAGVMPYDLGIHPVDTIRPRDIDVVDVCGLGHSLAVAALGRDGTLMLFRDILDDKKPLNFKSKLIEGVAYRLLSVDGHVFVLTNKALYMVADLAKRVINGEVAKDGLTQILTIPMTAVDANVFHDKYILVVNDKSNVFRVNLAAVERDIQRDNESKGESVRINYDREERSLVNTRGLLQTA